jgi:PadR family transcriptional regulator PadR
MMTENDKITNLEKLSQELRRGVLVLAALSQLEESRYGYALIERLSQQGLDIDQGTLYPLLRRLEEQGLLESEWKLEEARPRRYYKLNENGFKLLQELTQEWKKISDVMNQILKG